MSPKQPSPLKILNHTLFFKHSPSISYNFDLTKDLVNYGGYLQCMFLSVTLRCFLDLDISFLCCDVCL